MNFILLFSIIYLKLCVIVNGASIGDKFAEIHDASQQNAQLSSKIDIKPTKISKTSDLLATIKEKYKLLPNINATNDYLNQTILPFMSNCQNSSDFFYSLLCPSYYDMLLNLADNKQNFLTDNSAAEEMKKLKNYDVDGFCDRFIKIIPADSKFPELTSEVASLHQKLHKPEGTRMCNKLCLTMDAGYTFEINSICYITFWGYNKLSSMKIENKINNNSNSNDTSKTTTDKLVLIPKAVPVNDVKEHIPTTPPANLKNDVTTNANQSKFSSTPGIVPKVNENPINNIGLLKTEGIKLTTKLPTDIKSTAKQLTVTPKISVEISEKSTTEKKVTAKEEHVNSVEKPEINQHDGKSKSIDDKQIINDEGINFYNFDVDAQTMPGQVPGDDNSNENISLDDNTNSEDLPREELAEQETKLPTLHEAPVQQTVPLKNDPFVQEDDSNFFSYFLFIMLICVISYVAYHNKTKVLALVLEGRRSSHSGRGALGRKKHTAAYRKLDSNLEEAVTSNVSGGRQTHIIY